ncbi:MAG: hypothetical protein DMF47_01260, partial [Verrucomicrobia bacterium]
QPVVREKKRYEDRRDTDRHEPFIADVTRRMKRQPVRRKLVVKLPDERFECRALEPQAQLGDAAFEKILVAQGRPIGSFHFAHGISPSMTAKSKTDADRSELLLTFATVG